jgi:hypothetical protein
VTPGRYDAFFDGEIIHFTVEFEGGGADIRPGRGAGGYVVYAELA